MYLQVLFLWQRGLQVEQNARDMQESFLCIEVELEYFAEYYRLIGTHLSSAKVKYDAGLFTLSSMQRCLWWRSSPVSLVDALEDGEHLWEYGSSYRGLGRPSYHALD